MPQSVVSTDERVYRDDTLDAYERGVERGTRVMHSRMGEPLTIDDLADAAFMSRFHFTRVFTKITGVSPGRFLAAIRLQEAKRLLLQSDRSVTDISLDVGYSSLGTFTRIFTDFVGFPPARFRQLSRRLLQLTPDDIKRFLALNRSLRKAPSVTGEIFCDSQLALVTVAMFPTGIPRSHPIECVCLTESPRFSFSQRPPHGACIFAAGLLPTATIEDAILVSQDHIQVGASRLSTNMAQNTLSLELRPHLSVEPPIVVAFPLLIAESLMARQVGTMGEATATSNSLP